MDEETKQYCVTVKVWTWAQNPKHAEETVFSEMEYLLGLDTPIYAFQINNAVEDTEV